MPKPLKALPIGAAHDWAGNCPKWSDGAKENPAPEREEIEMKRAKLKMTQYGGLQFVRSAATRATATALAAAFAIGLATAAANAMPLPQNDSEQTPTVKERVMALPPHTLVQVRLHNKNLKGRVRIATRKGFVLQFTADGKNRNQKISYDDVQSIQPVEGNSKGTSFSIHVVIDGGSGGGVDVQIDH
jgi:hypothetical protein